MSNKVLFYRCTSEEYKAALHNVNAIYFILNTRKIVVNGVEYAAGSNSYTAASDYIDVSTSVLGYLVVPDTAVPIYVLINSNLYLILNTIHDTVNSKYKIEIDPFLSWSDIPSFVPPWRVWRASGKQGRDGTAAGFGTVTATAVQLLSSQSAYVLISTSGSNTNKNFYYKFGIPRGKSGLIKGNYIDVSTSYNGYVKVPNDTMPVSVLLSSGVYDITSVVESLSSYLIPIAPILARANVLSFIAPWRVWKAGGQKGADGVKGDTGVGIASITLLLDESDSGINQYIIVTTDGNFYTIHTRNGHKGSQGIQGEKGDKGLSGSQGPKGDTGDAGPANVLSIGTVTKGEEAIVLISGSSPNQVLSFVLPKGDKGDTGVGISSVTLNRSLLDSKSNEITIHLDNSTNYKFYVLNGSKGSQGIQGEKGLKGDPGLEIEDNYIDVSSSLNGYIRVPNDTIPVSVLLSSGVYDITSLILSNSSYLIPVLPILARADVSSFVAPWRVWRAGGKEGQKGTLTQATVWDSSTAYSRLAVVTYQGSCYQVISDNVPAGTLPTDTTKFIKIAGTVAISSLTINVGSTREIKTLSDAYDYIRTLNIGNGGTVQLVLDAETFVGGTFTGIYCNFEIQGATSSTTIISSDLTFINCASITLSQIKLLKLTCLHSKVTGLDIVIDASGYTFNVSAMTAATGSFLSFSNLTILGNTTYLKGIYSQGGSVVMIYSGITIQDCSIALYCDLDGFIYDSVAGTTLTGNTTNCSPAENTYGNYHSYICRL